MPFLQVSFKVFSSGAYIALVYFLACGTIVQESFFVQKVPIFHSANLNLNLNFALIVGFSN